MYYLEVLNTHSWFKLSKIYFFIGTFAKYISTFWSDVLVLSGQLYWYFRVRYIGTFFSLSDVLYFLHFTDISIYSPVCLFVLNNN